MSNINNEFETNIEILSNKIVKSFTYNDSNNDEDILYLAHYTDIQSMFNIFSNNEFWLSHPYDMNDKNELISYINISKKFIANSINKFNLYINKNINLMEIYDEYSDLNNNEHDKIHILCFSEIPYDNQIGKLSMWRGYGGNGSGVAIVFNGTKFNNINENHLTFGKVKYLNDYNINVNINYIIEEFIRFLAENKEVVNQNDRNIYRFIYVLHKTITMSSMFIKNIGFSEEEEWRLVYFGNDNYDKITLSKGIFFNPTKYGFNSKLKLTFDNLKYISNSVEFFQKIILGPTQIDSSNEMKHSLNKINLKNFLKSKGLEVLSNNIVQSSIPYRPR